MRLLTVGLAILLVQFTCVVLIFKYPVLDSFVNTELAVCTLTKCSVWDCDGCKAVKYEFHTEIDGNKLSNNVTLSECDSRGQCVFVKTCGVNTPRVCYYHYYKPSETLDLEKPSFPVYAVWLLTFGIISTIININIVMWLIFSMNREKLYATPIDEDNQL